MNPRTLARLAERLMRHPAVPYHEQHVRSEAERICEEHGLKFWRDRFGNLLVESKKGRRIRPVVLAAHLDHPGFQIIRSLSRTRWQARFCGGVPERYFRPGTRLLLMPGRERAILGPGHARPIFEISTARPVETPPRFAVWALPDFAFRKGRIYGRACDDLIGAAAVLATLIELRQARGPFHGIGVLSRAEEVGFRGALALTESKGIPHDSLVISLETSRELPGVKMGRGVILRIGDRTSSFDPQAMRFLGEIAGRLQKNDAGFQFQRGLMSGGTCEATAYQEFGFQTTAVCVALGNYHNCSRGTRIASEYITLRDACDMVDLLVATVRAMPSYTAIAGRLRGRLERMCRASRTLLARTA